MQPELSLVIPAYNEAERLPPYLASIHPYLQGVFGPRYEVIVVDDGSRDGLFNDLARRQPDWPQLLSLRLPHNQGKGAAIRHGIRAARGKLLLFADADGATPIEDEQYLREAIARGADVAIGSRLLPGARVSRARVVHRDLSGRLFAGLVRWLLGVEVRDTQCGFKMFRRDAGLRLFRLCRQAGYLLDLEILVLAQHLRLRLAEIPVTWREIPGSKVRLLRDGWKMLCGLYQLRRLRQALAGQPRRSREGRKAPGLEVCPRAERTATAGCPFQPSRVSIDA